MQRELDVEEAGEISWPVDCPGHSLPSMTGEPPVPTGHSSKKATFNSCYPFIAKFHMRASSAEFRQVRAMTEKSHHRLDSTLVSDRPTHSARATDDLLAQDIDLACLANRELGAAKGPAPPPVLQGGLHGNTVNKTRCTAAAFGLSRKQKRRALDREFGHGTTDFGKRMLRSRGRSVAHRRRRRGRRTVGHRNRHLMPRAVRGTGQETQNSEGERGNGQETDLNFERLLLCNLGATGLARCAVRRLCRCCRRLAKVEVRSHLVMAHRASHGPPSAHSHPKKPESARQGYWLHNRETHVPPGQGTYRVAPRTCNLCTPQRHCTTPPWACVPSHPSQLPVFSSDCPPALTLDPRALLPSRALRSISICFASFMSPASGHFLARPIAVCRLLA